MTFRSFRLLGAPCLAATLLAVPAQAQTTVTVIADRDNTLYENALGNLSNGSGDRIFAGITLGSPGTATRRALLHFDIAAAVPAGAQITAVELALTEVMTISGSRTVNVHRVLQDWGEGLSMASGGQGGGTMAETGDATWLNNFFASSTWTNAGGDFDPNVVSTITGSGNLLFPSSAAFVADAQSFLDQPSTNFGWMVKTDESGNAVSAYASREGAAGTRPELRITYVGGSAAANVPYGAGCTGTGPTVLTLAANSLPTVPNPGYALQLSGGPSPAVASFIGLSLLRSPIPLPAPLLEAGCFVELDLVTYLGAFATSPAGTFPLPIPNDAALVGARLRTQGFAAQTNFFLATSNGLELQLDL